MDYLTKISEQGFGYLLFVGALIVIFFLYKENKQLSQDRLDQANLRVQESKEAREAYALLSQVATKVAENTYTVVQNLQQLLNTWKKS